MRRFSFILFTLALAYPSFAQPEIDFIRLYDHGDTPADRFYDVYRAVNGDYLVCGSQSYCPWVLRLDSDGAPLWDYTENGMVLYNVIEADNGDVVTVGSIGEDSRFGAIRLTSDGEVVWRREYGAANGYRRAQAVIELEAGGFMLCGSIAGYGYINRIGENGDIIWEYSYRDGDYSPILFTMCETEDGVVAAGNGTSNQIPGNVLKISLNGEVLWRRVLGRTNTTLISTPEGFAIGANWYDDQTRQSGPWLIKIDEDGNVTDDTLFSLPFNTGNWNDCIAREGNSGFILATERTGGSNFPIAIRINNQNNILWIEDWSDSIAVQDEDGFNGLAGVIVEDENRIVACGWLNSRAHGGTGDAMLVRFQPEELNPIITSKSPEDTVQTILRDSRIEFAVHARAPYEQQNSYEWTLQDSVVGRDSTITLQFDSLGDLRVDCRISTGTGEISVSWLMHVRNLFIVSYSPDTLALDLRRGTVQRFAIDTVASVEHNWLQARWTLTNVNNMEIINLGDEWQTNIRFVHSGNFQLAGMAYNDDFHDEVIWDINVQSVILDFQPADLCISVFPDSFINFEVFPFDPESDSLSYRWEVDGDSVGSDSTVTLRFAWNSQAGRSTYAVAAIVMDGAEGDTVKWEVTVREPDEVGKWASGQVDKWGILSMSPNPFNSITLIRFVVPSSSFSGPSTVRLSLHDLTGREVRECVSAELLAGEYTHILNGDGLAAGIYLLRLEAGRANVNRKLVLIR